MKHRVLRSFQASGRDLSPGDVVDTSDWRFVRQLTEQRKIEPVTDTHEPKAGRGRHA